ncbi:hypothetical protein [Okeania sp. SIO1I7]|uniref:hypothetical protein n=1 Tax=Okeania sp. SIO1I7 TaxID=2607772 RepID=UPI0013FB8B3B|nr:hypothetical protein [Okeania sp. SIO1I7]NET26002.1 prefoldin subunit [Okeania sp. SIO1I7]
MTNKRFLDRVEKRTNFLIAVIGGLLIVIAAILVLLNKNFLVNAVATISGSVGGALISTGITGYINLDPLEKVGDSFEKFEKDVNNTLQTNKEDITKYIENLSKEQTKLIKDFQEKVRISCDDSDTSKNRLKRIDQKQYYRYFQTLNSDSNLEWRMKPLSFNLSDDCKRVNASIEYKNNQNTSYSYNIQASYWGEHFVLLIEESSGLDEPMIEIYPALTNFGREQIFSGISIRYPWGPNNLLITRSILSDYEISKENWEKLDQEYWIIKDTDGDKTREKMRQIWDNNMKDIQSFFSI